MLLSINIPAFDRIYHETLSNVYHLPKIDVLTFLKAILKEYCYDNDIKVYLFTLFTVFRP